MRSAGSATDSSPPPMTAMVGTCGRCGATTGGGGAMLATCGWRGVASAACAAGSSRSASTCDARGAGPSAVLLPFDIGVPSGTPFAVTTVIVRADDSVVAVALAVAVASLFALIDGVEAGGTGGEGGGRTAPDGWPGAGV